jgi:hypothetical protein
MPAPSMLRSIRLALGLGVVIGAGLGVWFADTVVGREWVWLGAFAGALFGAVSSFDALIPGPGRNLRPGRPPRVGPFRGGTMFVVAAVICFVAGFYAKGYIEFRCDRGTSGNVVCRRTYHGWLASMVTGEQVWSGVTGVWDGGPSRIVLILADDQRGIVDDFGPEYLAPIERWLKSGERELVYRSEKLGFFSPLFFVISVVVGVLGVLQLLRGIRALKAQLASGKVAWRPAD